MPEYAVLFTRLTLVVVLFEVLSAPLWLIVQASGDIRRYQMIISCILILNLPIAYMSFMVWKQPMLAFIAKILTAVLAYIYRVYSVRSLKCLNLLEYFKQLVLRICLLLVIMTPIVWVYMSYKSLSIVEIILNILLIIFLLSLVAFPVLLNRNEHKIIFIFVSKVLRKV
ncbi:hypothetical protein D3C76_1406200 [compost metagenome]